MVGISMKTITLCADDFSFSPGISEAILTLLKHRCLNATSCMVNTPYWHEHAADLKKIMNVKTGLHFTLTDVPPVKIPLYSLPQILKESFLRKLDQSDVEKEIELQLERFVNSMGRLPDFIDGHQHIHQLPIIRDALLSVYQKHFPQKNCSIRVPISKPYTLKSRIIIHTGALKLKKQLIKYNIPYNNTFSGVYDFSVTKNYSSIFTRFLKNIETNGLIMCHPGLASKNDKISKAREQEFHYFNSQQFVTDCLACNVTLVNHHHSTI